MRPGFSRENRDGEEELEEEKLDFQGIALGELGGLVFGERTGPKRGEEAGIERGCRGWSECGGHAAIEVGL
jgi:hypothetical protein